MAKANICHPVCVCGAKSKAYMSQCCRSALACRAYRWSFADSSDYCCCLLHDSFIVSYNEAVSFTRQQEQRNLVDYSEQSVSKSPICVFNMSIWWNVGMWWMTNLHSTAHRWHTSERIKKDKKGVEVIDSLSWYQVWRPPGWGRSEGTGLWNVSTGIMEVVN